MGLYKFVLPPYLMLPTGVGVEIYGESVSSKGMYTKPGDGTDSRIFILLNSQVAQDGTLFAFLAYIYSIAPIQFQVNYSVL